MARRFGLTTCHALAQPDEGTADPGVDLIFVHGLSGGRYKSWGKLDDSQTGSVFWPGAWLPETLQSTSTFAYSWDTGRILQEKNAIFDAAEELLAALKKRRNPETEKGRRLIFVCHSLGGLVLKEALNRSLGIPNRNVSLDNLQVAKRTCGIIFLGTPHSTPTPSLQEQLRLIALASGLATGADIDMEATKSIQSILATFNNLPWSRLWWKTISFFEELPLRGAESFGPVVGFHDTYLHGQQQIGVHANHESISKIGGPHTFMYRAIESSLKSLSSAIPDSVSGLVKQLTAPVPQRQDGVLQSLHVGNGLETISAAMTGTCSWILDHSAFKSWLDMAPSLLWISGKPGCGKSTISKFISHHLTIKEATASIFFFHSNQGAATRGSYKTLLKSLLYQLLTNKPYCQPSDMLNTYSDKLELLGTYGTDWEWDDRELEGYFHQSIRKVDALGQRVVIFVDGLDEYADHESILSFIQDVLVVPRIRVCISSRHGFQCDSLSLRTLSLDDHTATDIEYYVSSRLHSLDTSGKFIEDTLVQDIVDKAAGVFLWASLVVSNLDISAPRSATKGGIGHDLDSFPEDLGELHSVLLSRILAREKGVRRQQAINALQWTMCSLRPLSLPEMLDALSLGGFRCTKICDICESTERSTIPPNMSEEIMYHVVDQLKELSGGLLNVDIPPMPKHDAKWTSSTVTFIHRSVLDFFAPQSSARGQRR